MKSIHDLFEDYLNAGGSGTFTRHSTAQRYHDRGAHYAGAAAMAAILVEAQKPEKKPSIFEQVFGK